VVMTRQYLHNACIRCPFLLLPPADAPARLPLGVPRAGGGACTLLPGAGDCPGLLVLHPLGCALVMAMLAACRASSLVHQRTIVQVSRAFCAILAQNVGIVRKTCRAEGKMCHKRVTFGRDVQGRLVLRRSSRQVVVA